MKLLGVMLIMNSYCMQAFPPPLADSSAVTYDLNGGRLGDNLVTYIKAQWIAYKRGLPFLHVSFEYSDQFMIADYDKPYNPITDKRRFRGEKHLWSNPETTTIFKAEDRVLYFAYNGTVLAEGDILAIQDAPFIALLQERLRPRYPLPKIELPSDVITVALHVRKGGGYDFPLLMQGRQKGRARGYADIRWPLRFPPDEFYIQQLQKLAEMFSGQQLYVHLFTDDKEPHLLVERYKKVLNNQRITFAYRVQGNRHDANVVEDFFAMTYFDCLIRPDSCYSKCAQLLGSHKMVLYPVKHSWHGDHLTIDEVGIRTKGM